MAQALKEYLAALEAGARPDPKAFAARFPELGEELCDHLMGLNFIERIACGLRASDRPISAPALAAQTLGDFRILREVGRGGMGVVYEALQLSLGRQVALKILSNSGDLDEKRLKRFKNEVLAAAQLHHANIAPVYAVGCEGSVHYFAMQFIDGQTLAAVVAAMRDRVAHDQHSGTGADGPSATVTHKSPVDTPPSAALDTPYPGPCAATTPEHAPAGELLNQYCMQRRTYFRTVARIGIEAALALEHAHQLGVVHRDIKPGNLMLDRAGHLWVTDFGLARLASEVGPTMTGDFVGTLSYMSPEQALARRGLIDQRTDIYSLGVTLYELATLKPAFPGVERAESFRQIIFHEPTPPRRLDPNVPVDLETILQKAMNKEPAGRYQTAQDLADDLERFLEDQPVGARRPGPLQRTAKWCRRHRSVVTATVAMAIIGLAFSASFFWRGQVNAESAQQREEQAKHKAQTETERIRRVVDQMYEQHLRWYCSEPWDAAEDVQYLAIAESHYQRLALEPTDTPLGRFLMAQAHHRVGQIRLLIKTRQAQASVTEAIGLLKKLLEERPDNLEYQRELAGCYITQGDAFERLGQVKHAEASFVLARSCLEKLGATERVAETLASSKPRSARNDTPEDVERLADCEYRLGMIQEQYIGMDNRRSAEADAAFRRAEKIYAELAAKAAIAPKQPTIKDPTTSTYANRLAALSLHRGRLVLRAGRTGDAEPLLTRAIEAFEKLAAGAELLPGFRQELAVAHAALGELLAKTGRHAQAEQAYRDSEAAYFRLVENFPHVPRYQGYLADTQYALVDILRQKGDLSGARTLAEAAIRHSQVATEASPFRGPLHISPEELNRLLALVCIDQGDHASAARAADECANILNYCPYGARHAMQLYALLPAVVDKDKLLSDAKRKELVAKYLAREKQLQDEMLARSPTSAWFKNQLARHLVMCADPRVRDPARAARFVEQCIAAKPDAWQFWNTLGVVRYRNGDWKGTITAMEKASQMNGGTDAGDFLLQAMAYWHLEKPSLARKSFQTAVKLMEKGASYNKELWEPFRAEATSLLGPIAQERWAAAK
jgi:serine/threonine protein kinase